MNKSDYQPMLSSFAKKLKKGKFLEESESTKINLQGMLALVLAKEVPLVDFILGFYPSLNPRAKQNLTTLLIKRIETTSEPSEYIWCLDILKNLLPKLNKKEKHHLFKVLLPKAEIIGLNSEPSNHNTNKNPKECIFSKQDDLVLTILHSLITIEGNVEDTNSLVKTDSSLGIMLQIMLKPSKAETNQLLKELKTKFPLNAFANIVGSFLSNDLINPRSVPDAIKMLFQLFDEHWVKIEFLNSRPSLSTQLRANRVYIYPNENYSSDKPYYAKWKAFYVTPNDLICDEVDLIYEPSSSSSAPQCRSSLGNKVMNSAVSLLQRYAGHPQAFYLTSNMYYLVTSKVMEDAPNNLKLKWYQNQRFNFSVCHRVIKALSSVTNKLSALETNELIQNILELLPRCDEDFVWNFSERDTARNELSNALITACRSLKTTHPAKSPETIERLIKIFSTSKKIDGNAEHYGLHGYSFSEIKGDWFKIFIGLYDCINKPTQRDWVYGTLKKDNVFMFSLGGRDPAENSSRFISSLNKSQRQELFNVSKKYFLSTPDSISALNILIRLSDCIRQEDINGLIHFCNQRILNHSYDKHYAYQARRSSLILIWKLAEKLPDYSPLDFITYAARKSPFEYAFAICQLAKPPQALQDLFLNKFYMDINSASGRYAKNTNQALIVNWFMNENFERIRFFPSSTLYLNRVNNIDVTPARLSSLIPTRFSSIRSSLFSAAEQNPLISHFNTHLKQNFQAIINFLNNPTDQDIKQSDLYLAIDALELYFDTIKSLEDNDSVDHAMATEAYEVIKEYLAKELNDAFKTLASTMNQNALQAFEAMYKNSKTWKHCPSKKRFSLFPQEKYKQGIDLFTLFAPYTNHLPIEEINPQLARMSTRLQDIKSKISNYKLDEVSIKKNPWLLINDTSKTVFYYGIIIIPIFVALYLHYTSTATDPSTEVENDESTNFIP